MILQALADYYKVLVNADETTPRPGWCSAKVTMAVVLGPDGAVVDLLPLKETVTRGKKNVDIPRVMRVPEQEHRTAGVKANFLCDTASYLLGVDNKGKAQRTQECFAASAKRHLSLLENVNCPAAQAVCNFFHTWEPTVAQYHPVLSDNWDALMQMGNLVFRFDGVMVHEEPIVCQAWEQSYLYAESDGPVMQCLVTGRRAPASRLHTPIKGVRGAQSSGASLVSFNAGAFESYGKSQSYNAPVSQSAVFAYTTALNRLVAHRDHYRTFGDTTVIFWSQSTQSVYSLLFGMTLDSSQPVDELELFRVMGALSRGRPYRYENLEISPDMPFYVLGLFPNAGRLSVRFFLQNSFGRFAKNMMEHYERLQLTHGPNEREYLFPETLIWETVNQKSRDKKPVPSLPGALFRSILNNTRYPAVLYESVLIRIRSERVVGRARVAIIKAYLMKNDPTQRFKEALKVELNEQCNDVPYLLGRLFALLEGIQTGANDRLNATILDRYLNAACTTPSRIFPMLLRLENSHMRVLRRKKPGLAVDLDKILGKIINGFHDEFPDHLNLAEQGVFLIGYYHQREKRFVKKEQGA